MKRVKLGDVFKITSGGTPKSGVRNYYEDGTIAWVKTGDLKVRHLINIPDKITEDGLKNSSAKVFPVNTVLIAMYGATIGACSILKTEAATNQACAAFLPNKDVDEEYLYFYLHSIRQILIKQGVGGGQPNISGTILKNIDFPLPDLKTQRQIAHLLSRAEELIAARQQSLVLLDDFPKSTFLDLFGDPVKNEKGWRKEPLSTVTTSRLGKMLDKKKHLGVSRQFSYLGNSNVQWFSFGLADLQTMEFTVAEQKEFKLQYGDVLICEGGEVGRAAIWKNQLEECYYQKALHRVRPHNQLLTAEFLVHLLWFYAKFGGFRELVSVATIAHLTGEKLKSMRIPVPPLPLQTRFTEIVNHVEILKTQQRESLAQLQNLYQSLLQRAFAGELDVSAVKLPEPDMALTENYYPPEQPKIHRKSNKQSARKTKLNNAARRQHELFTDGPTDEAKDETGPEAGTGSKPVTQISVADQLTQWFQQQGSVTFKQVRDAFPTETYPTLHYYVTHQLQAGKLTQYFDDEAQEAIESRLSGRIKLIANAK